jgi:hypothetical protein
MEDDFRELEPDISDHPFEPGTWPDACGYVDERGWTCGLAGRSTPTSAGRNRHRHERQGGLDKGGTARRWRSPAGESEQVRCRPRPS